MKRYFITTLALLLISIGIVCLWKFRRVPSALTNDTTAAPEQSTTGRSDPSTSAVPSIADTIKRAGQTIDAAQTANVPIAFWGQVVDQNGKGLAGANVSAGIRHWSLTPTLQGHASSIKVKALSGSDGVFSIANVSGDVLELDAIFLDGYELSAKAKRAFDYTRGVRTSPTNPVVFRMWKHGIKQPLLKGSGFFGIIPDGRTYAIDFTTGKKSETTSSEGDLIVSITRPLDAVWNSKYDWAFTLKAVGGGIFEEKGDFMYLAPEDGYDAVVQYQFKEQDPSWTHRVRKQFFAKTRNGQHFARLNVEVFAHYDNEAVYKVEYAVNTNGSRILE
jgi:hypothetical protein